MLIITSKVGDWGADHAGTGLPGGILMRLGPPATPERHCAPTSATAVLDYFGAIVYQYTRSQAIADRAALPAPPGVLLVHLTDSDAGDRGQLDASPVCPSVCFWTISYTVPGIPPLCPSRCSGLIMCGLLEVAEHLSDCARRSLADEADAFGRSAFNRYYYACFLSVRDLLAKVDDAWIRQGHSNIPDLLEGGLLKRMKEYANRQHKAGMFSQTAMNKMIHEARGAAGDIAEILRLAYQVRVVADYDPSHRITHSHGTLILFNHSDTEAKGWTAKVEQRKGVLLGISRRLGIVT